MKKSLVLAMAMALGVTASAYAANPFSDVPAGHWAYDSIDKLAAAGVIDGMGDGTYQGDKTMTRYEMAQIVAKAMAKGANVDKLAAEFADELDNLGVRVANLEKKADNVKITGAINLHTRSMHADQKTNHYYRWRSDLTIAGQINEDWKYTALLRNDQLLDHKNAGKGEENVAFQRAYVNGRVGGLAIQAGRYDRKLANGEVYHTRVDGIEATYGKKIKVTVGYDQLAGATGAITATDPKGEATEYGNKAKVAFVEVKAPITKAATLEVDYYKVMDLNKGTNVGTKGGVEEDRNIIAATLGYKVTKSVNLTATYLHSDASNDDYKKKNGYTVKAEYKGAKAAAPGSWGAYAKYVVLPKSVWLGSDYTTNQTWNWDGVKGAGVKGAIIGANYAFAKNIVGTVEYNRGVNKEGAHQDVENLFAGLTFTF